jgi:hypothetical protein
MLFGNSYSKEGVIRLHEIFLSRLVPGFDVLGYAEIRELFSDAGVLADPSHPEEMPPAARDADGAGRLRAYALADALLDQGSYETFVVGVIGDAVAARRAARDRRAKRRQEAADRASGILDDPDEESRPVRGGAGADRRRSSSKNRRRKSRRKGKRDKTNNPDAAAIMAPPPPPSHPALFDLEQGSITGKGPRQCKGLGFPSFVELLTVLEREGHCSLLGILRRLGLPLSTGGDRWRRQVQQALEFAVRIAVEERGPTEDEIALARAARELRRIQSMQGRPKAHARKKKSARAARSPSRGSRRGGKGRSKSPLGSPAGPSQAEVKAQKAARKAKIMARQLELESERRADQKRAWKRRYGFDVDEVIDPWNLCVIVYGLCNVLLTEEDAGQLLTPLLASERADDAETFGRAVAAGRTKRLRVIVEKQGMPPREWPVRKTVLSHMVANKSYWMGLSDSIEFVKDDPDSRPSSRASSRRGRRSRGGSRPGSRGATGGAGGSSRPGSRGAVGSGPGGGSSRPGSRGTVGTGPGGSRPGSRPGTAQSGMWADMFAYQPNLASPHYWAHRTKVALASRFRRMRQVGRKVVAEMKDYASKMSPAREDPALKNQPGGANQKKPNLGKSKADRKARRKLKAESLARLKQQARENDCTARCAVSVGGLEKAALDMSDPHDFVTVSVETKEDKAMDVGDLLDDVEAPEDCTTFLSFTLRVAEGFYEHEEDVDEIDKCVVVVRRILKLFFEEQIFRQLPFYHSYNVMYDPDRDRRHVKCTVFFSGTPEDIRDEWGIPLPLSSVITKLEMKAIFVPAAKTCFNEQRREDLILERDFRMRVSGTCRFKRRLAHRVLGYVQGAMATMFPYVGPHRRKQYKKKKQASNNEDANNGSKGAVEAAHDDHWEEDVAAAVVAAAKAREKEKRHGAAAVATDDDKTTATLAAMKVADEEKDDAEAFAGGSSDNVDGAEEVDAAAAAAENRKQASAAAQRAAGDAEANEDQGGRGIAPKLRKWLSNLRSWIPNMEKTEVEIALPGLSRLLMPETPDCWRFEKFGGWSPRKHAQLHHLVHGAGGLFDTSKLVWDAMFGDEFRFDDFERRLQGIAELLEHNETNKMEELIHVAHRTFRLFLPSLASVRLQSGEQGLLFEFENFMFDGFIPDGGMPSREQVLRKKAAERAAKAKAEKDRVKAEKDREKARISQQESKGIFAKLKK